MVRSPARQALTAYLTAAPFVVFALFPFAWMLVTSLKKNAELYDLSQNPFLIRAGITWEHYQYLFAQSAFPLWLRNSIIVAVVSTGASVVLALLAAYALARLRFRYAEGVSTFVFVIYLLPTTL
ncbi:MAG TPA: carbohydrate ABC transporter permease, partial [bacterium]|nr:carbohydrate ABC transporter permease [bacterium]